MASPGNPILQNQNQQFDLQKLFKPTSNPAPPGNLNSSPSFPAPTSSSSSSSSPPPYPLPSSSYRPPTGPSYPFHHAHFPPYPSPSPSPSTPTPTPPDHHFHHHQLPLPNLYEIDVRLEDEAQQQLEVTQLPRPSSSADAIDAEAPSQAIGEDAVDPAEAARNGGVNPAQAARNGGVNHMEWADIVIAACLASAIEIALQSVQMSGLLQPSSAQNWLSSQCSSSGLIVKRTLRVDIPVEKYPNFNFVGSLLGPRGNSLKRVEASTECHVLIRGRGSIKDPTRDENHYFYKKQQLRELAMINGTLREEGSPMSGSVSPFHNSLGMKRAKTRG